MSKRPGFDSDVPLIDSDVPFERDTQCSRNRTKPTTDNDCHTFGAFWHDVAEDWYCATHWWEVEAEQCHLAARRWS